MNYSVFTKTIKNVRKKINCEGVTDEKRRDKLVTSPYFEKLIIVNENIGVIKSKTSKSRIEQINLLWICNIRIIKIIDVRFSLQCY